MNNLYLVLEHYTNGYNIDILSLISLFSVLCAIFVIVSKNPIVSVLFLIGLFANISCYLIIIGLTFIGLSYLIVYIGAVSILFLFILMLINIRISELESNTRNSMLLALNIILLFNYSFSMIALPLGAEAKQSNNINMFNSISNVYLASNDGNEWANSVVNSGSLHNSAAQAQAGVRSLTHSLNTDNIYYVTGSLWDGNLADMGHMTSIGNLMYTNYNVWLIMASFILLLAMVGAIVITIKPKH